MKGFLEQWSLHVVCAALWCTSALAPFPPVTITCFGTPEAGTPPAVLGLPVHHCYVDAGSAHLKPPIPFLGKLAADGVPIQV